MLVIVEKLLVKLTTSNIDLNYMKQVRTTFIFALYNSCSFNKPSKKIICFFKSLKTIVTLPGNVCFFRFRHSD